MLAKIDETKCTGCGICLDSCPTDVLRMDEKGEKAIIKYPGECTGCYECELICPSEAISVYPLKEALPSMREYPKSGVINIADLESPDVFYEADVLVIGGGAAGLWAANRARQFVEKVLVVDKGAPDYGGMASRAGGDFIAVLPEENVDDFVKELVYYYDGLCEQDIIDELLRQSFNRLEDYERLGVKFLRGKDGKLKGVPRQGLDYLKCYFYRPYGTGGKEMVRAVVEEANRLGVKRLSRIVVANLLKHDGAVVGAVGFNTISGDFHIFKARATILATGGTVLGGIGMALEAGVELKNCEFATTRPTPKMFQWEGQTSLFPLGARLVNAKGEHLMEKYSPKLGSNTDWHYNSLGMSIEAREGGGSAYLDCSTMNPEDIELMAPETGWQLLNYNKLLELGIDFFRQNTEWGWNYQGTCAGIIADINGYTKVPGLFVTGTTCATEPGVYMGGWNLCKTAVTGHIVGESASKYAASRPDIFQIEETKIEELKSSLFAPLGKTGITPQEVIAKIREAVTPYDVCLVKNEANMKKALDKVMSIKNELLPRMAAGDAHYLAKLIEARDTTMQTELFLRGSLMRKESRAGHYREDYPDHDDETWLKWIVISQNNDRLILRTDPVPLERYKFKPTRYYIDNFKFPKSTAK